MNLTAKDMGQRLALLRPELISHGLRLTKDMSQAEDLAQDTIERALRFESRFEEGTNLRAWVHHILTNLFISGCRRQRREVKAFAVLSTDPCAWTASGTDRIAMEGFTRSVQRAIDEANKNVSRAESIRKFTILGSEWTEAWISDIASTKSPFFG